eukprot:gb/GECG01000986.1/.p1 GENE.gb/GECG01000986.1/~~gb/GECG01000986.1/.p1  ORF type:complete len:762 (+),score=79.87 gb/GECG01000986.1/:1-2286(+)
MIQCICGMRVPGEQEYDPLHQIAVRSLESVFAVDTVPPFCYFLDLQRILSEIFNMRSVGLYMLKRIGIALCSLGCILMQAEASDRRGDVLDGSIDCLSYESATKTFHLMCSFLWTSNFASDDFISLNADETFEGSADLEIDLEGTVSFKGIFTSTATSFDAAPLIRHVHVRRGGDMAKYAGYIVQGKQKYFKVDSCSSTGNIGDSCGGITGYECGKFGHVDISNCWTSGAMAKFSAGGIAGGRLGWGGQAVVSNCSASGRISINGCGGIVGPLAGIAGGNVLIFRCKYSGDIFGASSGGIVGPSAASAFTGSGGMVRVEQCYTLGKIAAVKSGGIIGFNGAFRGTIYVNNSFSRGEIAGPWGGGITAMDLARFGGKVYLDSVYASGKVTNIHAGGIFSNIDAARNTVEIRNSVYFEKFIGDDTVLPTVDEENVASICSIAGKLLPGWSSQVWSVSPGFLPLLRGTEPCPVGCQAELELLQFCLPPTPTPTTTVSPTSSPTVSPSKSPSSTSTGSATHTASPTSTTTGTSSSSTTTPIKTRPLPSSGVLGASTGNSKLETGEMASAIILPILVVISLTGGCLFIAIKRSKNAKRDKTNAAATCAIQLEVPVERIRIFNSKSELIQETSTPSAPEDVVRTEDVQTVDEIVIEADEVVPNRGSSEPAEASGDSPGAGSGPTVILFGGDGSAGAATPEAPRLQPISPDNPICRTKGRGSGILVVAPVSATNCSSLSMSSRMKLFWRAKSAWLLGEAPPLVEVTVE